MIFQTLLERFVILTLQWGIQRGRHSTRHQSSIASLTECTGQHKSFSTKIINRRLELVQQPDGWLALTFQEQENQE